MALTKFVRNVDDLSDDGGYAVSGIDRGLRGQERDAAYEQAVHEATSHFHKCSHCGKWVCGHCWNPNVGMCEGCAPDASEAAAREAAQLAQQQQVAAVRERQATSHAPVTCPACGEASGGGKFCKGCGANLSAARACAGCKAVLSPSSRFCGECGTRC
jgi:hypothetical protein